MNCTPAIFNAHARGALFFSGVAFSAPFELYAIFHEQSVLPHLRSADLRHFVCYHTYGAYHISRHRHTVCVVWHLARDRSEFSVLHRKTKGDQIQPPVLAVRHIAAKHYPTQLRTWLLWLPIFSSHPPKCGFLFGSCLH